MKKTISIALIGGQLIFSSHSHAQDFDLEQFQRRAEEAVKYEKGFSVPAAITSHYSQSLYTKYFTIHQIIDRYNKATQNLNTNTEYFNKKIKSYDTNSIKTLENYKNFLDHVNDLDKKKDDIKNSLYLYQKSEYDLLELKDLMKNYCEETSNYERSKSLVLNPTQFQLHDYDFKTGIHFNHALGKDPDVTGAFLGTIGILAISGITIALIANGGSLAGLLKAIAAACGAGGCSVGATGWGAAVLVAVVVIALVVASIVHEHKQQKERDRIEKLKKEIKRRYEEAIDWYKKNTIIQNQEILRKMTFDLCTVKNFKVNIEIDNQKPEKIVSIYDSRKDLEVKIDNSLLKLNETKNNITYGKETSKKLQHLYSLASGNIFDPELRNFKDPITLNLIKTEEQLVQLKKELDIKREELAKLFSKQEIEQVQASFASSRKLAEATNILYQKIGTEKVHELFSNHLNNSQSCNLYLASQESILYEIEVLKNSILENYVDDLNKNNPFFTKKIPEVINLINKITTIRTNRVCKDYIE